MVAQHINNMGVGGGSNVNIKIKSSGGQIVSSKALIDTGNSIRQGSGVAISGNLHRKLNLGFVKLGGKPINTAGKGSKLTVQGVSTAMKYQFPGIQTTYEIKPIVIENLTDDINIGTSYLQKIGVSLEYSTKGNRMSIAGDKNTVELIRKVDTPTPRTSRSTSVKDRNTKNSKREPSTGGRGTMKFPIHALQTTVVPANSLTFVKVKRNKRTMCVENTQKNSIQVIQAVYKDTEKVAVLNSTDQIKVIRRDQEFGRYVYLKEGKIVEPQKVAKMKREHTDDAQETATNLIEELGIDKN